MAGCIHYYCSGAHAYTIGIFAAYFAREVADRILVLPYNTLDSIPAFGPGAHIFTDFERLPDGWRTKAARLADRLAANGCRVLNHPTRTLGRYDLLRALHGAGINLFSAHLLSDWRAVGRFPVFIRRADAHAPPLTDLVHHRQTLQVHAERLLDEYGARSDLIIVEFGNAKDADGRYRKYSAFRVGNVDYASSCQASDYWWIKYSPGEASDAERDEHLRFVAENPHREQLDAIWKAGQVDYGRVDYCVVSGRAQAFEINTSPTISYLPNHALPGHWSAANAQHDQALARLLEEAGGTETGNPLCDPAKTHRDARAVHEKVLRWGSENWPGNWQSSRAPS